MRVLFIGNSYTYNNDLPGMLEGLVRALSPGTRMETGAVLLGGATLESHWKRGEARELLRGEAWSHVVLVGTWQGTLSLYPAELEMAPVPMWLSVEPRGTRLTGQVRILFPRDAPLEGDVTPRVEGEALAFSLDDARLLGATLHFRAVGTEGGLRGVAHAQDSQGGRWFGSWFANPSSPA
ncbi:hypothetical protein [Cystobacter ferrugineus]|uniref:Uncharacterized protein n=1 Tax=Cystobacter ferrugineus TaxID=83449 RepID=A0A1L9B0Q7_9BACT|nr:hypothetical protein [Cystobacter ferrugineus]OJH35743.1 hypothetical protein BON30_37455 [Cystobacter ferrugineus]